MQFADEAFDILGFNKEEKYNVYKLTASVMHLGEMKFKKKSAKDDQATADGTKAGEKVATLLGVKVDDLYENFERPKIKVGAEWVTKVQKFWNQESEIPIAHLMYHFSPPNLSGILCSVGQYFPYIIWKY